MFGNQFCWRRDFIMDRVMGQVKEPRSLAMLFDKSNRGISQMIDPFVSFTRVTRTRRSDEIKAKSVGACCLKAGIAAVRIIGQMPFASHARRIAGGSQTLGQCELFARHVFDEGGF